MDVQLEDGYTRIANAILEELPRRGLSGRQLGMMLVLVRRTWGYNQTSAPISARSLAREMEIDHRNAQGVLRDLVARNMVVRVDRGERKTPTLSIQKDFDLWQSGVSGNASGNGPSGVVDDTPSGVTGNARAGVVHNATPKKERKKKERRAPPAGAPPPGTHTEEPDLSAAIRDKCARLRPWLLSEEYGGRPPVPSWSWGWVEREIADAREHSSYAKAKSKLAYTWKWVSRGDNWKIEAAKQRGLIEKDPSIEVYRERLARARADTQAMRKRYVSDIEPPREDEAEEIGELWAM
ncbi:MAG: replication protein [Dehalococcoidia bacterium]